MSRSSNSRKGRVTSDYNANQRLPFPTSSSVRRRLFDAELRDLERVRERGLPIDNRAYEDRRQWHPDGDYRPARSYSRSRQQLKLSDPMDDLRDVWQSTRAVLAFSNPRDVLVCVRRKMRREVLHAFRKTGRGGGRKRPPRYNWFSKIKC